MRTRVYHYVGGGDEMRWVQETRRREKETMMIKRWSSVTLYTRDPIQYTAHYSIDNGRFEMKRSASGIGYRAIYRVPCREIEEGGMIHSFMAAQTEQVPTRLLVVYRHKRWNAMERNQSLIRCTVPYTYDIMWQWVESDCNVWRDVTWLVLHSIAGLLVSCLDIFQVAHTIHFNQTNHLTPFLSPPLSTHTAPYSNQTN